MRALFMWARSIDDEKARPYPWMGFFMSIFSMILVRVFFSLLPYLAKMGGLACDLHRYSTKSAENAGIRIKKA